MTPMTVTNHNFNAEVAECSQLVLVDFWAAWCGPCKMIAPYVEQVAEEYPHITVGKIDVDTQQTLAMEFGITSIPTLIVMENGQKVDQALGYRPKESILKLLGE